MAKERELQPQQIMTTQGATQSQASNIWTQMESQPVENIVWGRLYGKNIKLKSIGKEMLKNIFRKYKIILIMFADLNTESFTAGRGENNDLILTLRDLPERILCRISKEHFVITRPNCDLSNPVYIEVRVGGPDIRKLY